MNWLVDFIIGFLIGRSAVSNARTARNSALAAERAAWTEAQKLAFQQRQNDLAGERRFVYGVFIVIIAIVWAAGALIG
jgi:hypothetical protein